MNPNMILIEIPLADIARKFGGVSIGEVETAHDARGWSVKVDVIYADGRHIVGELARTMLEAEYPGGPLPETEPVLARSRDSLLITFASGA